MNEISAETSKLLQELIPDSVRTVLVGEVTTVLDHLASHHVSPADPNAKEQFARIVDAIEELLKMVRPAVVGAIGDLEHAVEEAVPFGTEQ